MSEKEEEKEMSIALSIGMGVFILLTSVIALLLATPFEVSDIKAFENPESMMNSLYFFSLVIGFTALILIVFKYIGKRLVYFVMLAAVAATIYYVMLAFEAPFYKFIAGVSVPIYTIMQLLRPYSTVPLVITLALTLILYKYPEWYVLDAIGLIIGGGAAAIFGISLGILPVLLLMVILAAYDAIAVYKTKHMVSLAESIVDMRVPILFVLPRKRQFSLLKNSGMGEAFFMGLGDAIIPSLLVVSANRMSASSYYYLGLINAPALGALIGTLAGYAVLSRIAGRGKPHAGLPFLNSGAIIGFVIGNFLF
jgi:presenilin-like A22 family membrane protease